MSDSVSSVLLHPVRLRIAQHLALHTQATVRQLGEALPDVPAASLYRHLRRMTELGVLEIVREMPVRGTVERTYALARPAALASGEKEAASPQELRRLIPAFLAGLSGEFEAYLSEPDADLRRDGLGIRTASLLLSDAEFARFQEKLAALIVEAASRPPGEGRRQRQLTCILSPVAPCGQSHERRNSSC